MSSLQLDDIAVYPDVERDHTLASARTIDDKNVGSLPGHDGKPPPPLSCVITIRPGPADRNGRPVSAFNSGVVAEALPPRARNPSL